MENKTHAHKHNGAKRAHVSQAASELLNESKKLAHELYEEGLDKMSEAQREAQEYSDKILKKVKENPVTSLLIAGGIGFILSKLLKK